MKSGLNLSPASATTPGPLIALVMVLLLARHLIALLSPDQAWMAADTLRAASMSAASLLVLILLPWRMLKLKCLVAAMTGYYVADMLLCIAWYYFGLTNPVIVGVVQGAAFALAAILYWLRSYERPEPEVMRLGSAYELRAVPRRPQDFVIALAGLFGAAGGYAIWADGKVYSYRHGILVATSIDRLPAGRYHVSQGVESSPELIAELESMVGSRWTWRHNCITVIAPIWRRHGGRS